jgi:hypothetical protein
MLEPAPPRTEIEIKFEIAGLEIPPDELDHVVDNDMLVAAMKRMGETIREELGGMICPVHNLPPFVTVSLSSTEGLRTHIDGCCTQIVQITTAPLKEALKQTAPFGSHMTLVIYVEDSTEPLVFEVHQIDELVFGRADPRAAFRPEIDLTAHQGAAKGVSRRHARIIWWHGALHIVDEDSANGTYLNGHGLAPQEHYLLRNGDEIRLGDLALRLEFVTDD